MRSGCITSFPSPSFPLRFPAGHPSGAVCFLQSFRSPNCLYLENLDLKIDLKILSPWYLDVKRNL